MLPDVSVIVVTWNALDHVDECLDAVLGAGGRGVDLELVVVDNDSNDGTAAHVRSRYPDAVVLETGRNGGMAAGNNAGMQVARGRSFLLLNSDAFLQEGALETMVDRLRGEAEGTVAAVAPALRNVDGSVQRSVRGFPSTWRYFTEFSYLRRLAPNTRAFNAFYGGGLDLSRSRRIDWATGACLLVPRDAVEAVGLMDEAYFMYGEEVDWLRRMSAHGRDVVWEPAALVTHVGGGSARTQWGELYQRQLANHVRYMAQCEGPGAARRTRRMLTWTLRLRALAWRIAGVVPIGDRAQRRERAATYVRGVRTIADAPIDGSPAARIPELRS